MAGGRAVHSGSESGSLCWWGSRNGHIHLRHSWLTPRTPGPQSSLRTRTKGPGEKWEWPVCCQCPLSWDPHVIYLLEGRLSPDHKLRVGVSACPTPSSPQLPVQVTGHGWKLPCSDPASHSHEWPGRNAGHYHQCLLVTFGGSDTHFREVFQYDEAGSKPLRTCLDE